MARDLIYPADAAVLLRLRRSQVGAAAALHVAVLKPQEMSASSHHGCCTSAVYRTASSAERLVDMQKLQILSNLSGQI